MKAKAFTLLALLLTVACSQDPISVNQTSTRPDREMSDTNRVYTIGCEMGGSISGEWIIHQTKRHPFNAYGGRSGIWSFLTIEGDSIYATNCAAVIPASAK